MCVSLFFESSGVENLDLPAPSNKANMMVVGLSLGVLALVYIFAVLVYLKIRRQMIAKQKANTDQEAKLQSRGDDNSDKVRGVFHLLYRGFWQKKKHSESFFFLL